MSAEVKVPQFPESVEEGTLTSWHKQEGDSVERDEKVADIETDKIVLEVSAPEAGVLSGIEVKEGDSVKPGTVLARIESGEGKSGKTPEKKSGAEESDAKEAEDDKNAKDEEDQEKERSGGEAAEEQAAKKEEPDEKVEESREEAEEKPAGKEPGTARLSPAVRRMVEEHDLDVNEIDGTGRGGVVTKGDVLQYLDKREAGDTDVEKEEKKEPEKQAAPEAAASVRPEAKSVVSAGGGRPEKRVAMSRIRARIAERLVEAQQTAAILTTFNEVNMQPIVELRNRYKEQFEKSNGVKLGFMSFFVKAAVDALKQFPVVNATLDGKDMVYHGYYDIGVAVSTDRGLVVPILRDADQQSYADIEKNIVDFATRAREGKLGMDDLTGGTFSITNGGIFGSLLSTPILNPPQSAILGMHQIQERPVAEEGQVVVRPVMYLALSYDHRIIDGREAVQFLVAIKENLQDPARTLLNL